LEEWILRGFGSHGLVVDLLDSEFCWLWQWLMNCLGDWFGNLLWSILNPFHIPPFQSKSKYLIKYLLKNRLVISHHQHRIKLQNRFPFTFLQSQTLRPLHPIKIPNPINTISADLNFAHIAKFRQVINNLHVSSAHDLSTVPTMMLSPKELKLFITNTTILSTWVFPQGPGSFP
jgi:hypothetical protein